MKPHLPLLILRPQPGTDMTAARAANLGFDTVSAPLFAITPVAWAPPPPDDFDALLLTSANAARHAGSALQQYRALPCLSVGSATADAARAQGIESAWTGDSDGKAALAVAADMDLKRLLWLCGQQHSPLVHPKIALTIVPVYEAKTLPLTPVLRDALSHPAIVLLHSPRAAWTLAEQVEARAHLGVIAISPAVAAVAGEGWAWVDWPQHPRDQDMLELAARLCQKARP